MLNFNVSHNEFLANYFEQQPLLCAASLSEPIMQWHDLDLLLHSIEPDEQLIQMFLNGQVPPASFLDETIAFGRCRKIINKHHFYNLLQNGATLVLNRVENFSIAAKRLCMEVGKFAQQPTTGNAYVSFCGTGSFGKHWDTHDVFAIQLVGKKLWQLYPPTLPLPLSQQTSRKSPRECPATPTFECILAAGDVLYIPRGWWHQVTPLDVASLHLSVGTYPPTVLDYVLWVCNRQLPQLLEARRSCVDMDSLKPDLATIMGVAVKEVLDNKNMKEFIYHLHTRERLSSEFQTALLMGTLDSNLNEHVQLSLTSVYKIESDNFEIPANGGRLKLTPISYAVVNLLNRTGSLNWPELCAELLQYPQTAVRNAVLDLARYDILNIQKF
ncbi:MAG: cupin domain-containing protein [Pseudomonadota bacterium]